jgi:DNA-binding transcriptional regulator YiaG
LNRAVARDIVERMTMTLDASRAPLFIATASGILTDDEYEAQLAEWTEQIIKPDRPYAFVYNGTGIRRMTPAQRKLQADWINCHRATIKRLNRGCGFAFDSAFTRGLLRAVHWLSPPPYPYAIFATRQEAVAFCLRQLATEPRFGARFRILRQELAGKQSVLVAEGLRCTDAAISLWETGRRLPSSGMLVRAIGVFARLGATSEDIEQLRSAWIAERADRRGHPPYLGDCSG